MSPGQMAIDPRYALRFRWIRSGDTRRTLVTNPRRSRRRMT